MEVAHVEERLNLGLFRNVLVQRVGGAWQSRRIFNARPGEEGQPQQNTPALQAILIPSFKTFSKITQAAGQ